MERGLAAPAHDLAGGRAQDSTPIDQLLADGARFAQEFESVSARVGGTQAVYRQEPRKAAEVRGQIPAR